MSEEDEGEWKNEGQDSAAGLPQGDSRVISQGSCFNLIHRFQNLPSAVDHSATEDTTQHAS